MQGTNDVRKFVHGAEQAEARGDHVAAEQLLRRALVLQEFSLGAQHPEVANTLNNLAIVCEMNGKFGDAEACYRRAYAIATSSLSPTDPFTETSRENLEQFCLARGLPFNRQATSPLASSSAPVRPAAPPPKPPAAVPPKTTAPPQKAAPPPPKAAPSPPKAAPSPPTPTPRHAAPSPKAAPPTAFPDLPLRPPPAPAPPSRSTTTHAATMAMPSASRPAAVRVGSRGPSRAILLALAAFVLVAAGWFWFQSNDAPDRSAAAPASSVPSSSPAPEPAPSASAPAPVPEAPPASTKPTEPTPPPPSPEPVTPPPPVATAPEAPRPTTRPSSVNVVIAQVCRNLTRSGAWTCSPATGAQSGGTMYFYTRVASPRETTIEHRWYRDDRLQQRIPLRIRPNPAGFRTYSQTRISADSPGSWKVELRSQDGEVLHEETFAVK